MKLLVVIANYKVAHLTIDCLRAISAENPNICDIRVAVCENGTGDDSAERIQSAINANGWGTWCTLTSIPVNLGFTGGNNVLLRSALESTDRPQYIMLLNADTIVRPNAFGALLEFMESNPHVGIGGSRLEEPDGTPQRSVFRYHSPLSEFESGVKLGLVTKFLEQWVVAPPVPDHACEAPWVSGASMIIRTEVFRDIALLDEGYFTYYEDIDFCFNARKAGWQIFYVPKSRVIHLGSQTTGVASKKPGRQPTYVFDARRRYFLKNHGRFYAALADIGRILGLSLWKLRVLLGKSDKDPPFMLRDSIRHSVFAKGFKLQQVQNPALLPIRKRANETTD